MHQKRGEVGRKRHQQINESFNNIKTVKLYGWEGKFQKSITDLYDEEDALADKAELSNRVWDVTGGLLHHFMPITVFFFYTYFGNTLTLAQMALTTMMLERTRGGIGHIKHLFNNYYSILDSMEKLWEFYCAPESQTGLMERIAADKKTEDDIAVSIKGHFSWGITPKLDRGDKDKINEKLRERAKKERTKNMSKATKFLYEFVMPEPSYKFKVPLEDRTLKEMINLKSIDLNIKKGSFTVIIGECGSGKSSLLSALIGEMIHMPDQVATEIGDWTRPIKDGEQRYIEDALLQTDLTKNSPIKIAGTTGFCEQQPWIQNGKLRDNVLFGQEFDKQRYVETIMACQLEADLAIMPAGDLSEIGEKGINLSGGQKARVALARAVYRRPDVLIMDDPISALDCQVRKEIFDQVFVGLMDGKTRILVTHAVDFIHLADHIVIMKDGEIQAQGSYDELIFNPYLMQIQDIHTKNKKEIQEANDLDAIETPDLATAKTEQLSANDKLDGAKTVQRQLSQSVFISKKEMKKRLSTIDEESIKKSAKDMIEIPLKKTISSSEANPQAESDSEETLVKITFTEEELDAKLKSFGGINNELDDDSRKKIGKLLVNQEDEEIVADKTTIKKLWDIAGGWYMVFYIVVLNIALKFWSVYEQRAQQEYAAVDPEQQAELHSYYMKKIAIVVTLNILIHNIKDMWMQRKRRNMGKDMKRTTLQKILEAPVNLFFDVTPIGKILEIFHSDLRVFHGEMIDPFNGMTDMMSHIIVVITMMINIGSWEVVIGFVLVAYLMNKVGQPWITANDQLGKIGGTLWGPIHSYFHECMRGTNIIRAFD